MNTNIIVLDIEIEKAIQNKKEARLPGIEYCDGWRDFAGMGIACICTYATDSHLTRVFLKEDLEEFKYYVADRVTAGFNTRRFDNKLLKEHGVEIDEEKHYDILEEIWRAQGLNTDKFSPTTHGGVGLDTVAGGTLGEKKSGHGAMAPVWWQQGKRGKVIDYCCRDAWLEGQLLEHIVRVGTVCTEEGRVITGIRRP
jgi:hypothetical protein